MSEQMPRNWEHKPLYLDDLDQYVPVELRRNRPGAEPGKPPSDKIVPQLKVRPPHRHLIDISGTRDGTLLKETTDVQHDKPPEFGQNVRQGARVRARITVTDPDRNLALEERLLHGPKEHEWIAGSGNRCQVVELAVASMHVQESCVVRCSDPSLYADPGLGIRWELHREAEFSIHVLEATPEELPKQADELLQYATQQKEQAGVRLSEGMVQLALVKYQLLAREVSEFVAEDQGGTADDQLQRARNLLSVLELNKAACFLKLRCWIQAQEVCNAVIAGDKENIKALYRRGVATLNLMHTESAMKDFKTILEIDPKNTYAKTQVEHCQAVLRRASDKAKFREERKQKPEQGKWD